MIDIRGYEDGRSYRHELDDILEGKISDGYEVGLLSFLVYFS